MKAAPLIAHRGLARLYPENTRAAVLGALGAGLRRVEIDVQLSADGVPLLHHDADLKRMSGRRGDLRRKPWSELKAWPCHEPARYGRRFLGERICSLGALAKALKGRRGFTLFVELKQESLRRFGRGPMLQAVEAALKPIRRRCALISFDLEVLVEARRRGGFPLGLVLSRRSQLSAPAVQALAPEWIFCDRRLLPRRGSLAAAFAPAKLAVYEVPEAEEARALLLRGAAAIETFFGDRLARALKTHVFGLPQGRSR